MNDDLANTIFCALMQPELLWWDDYPDYLQNAFRQAALAAGEACRGGSLPSEDDLARAMAGAFAVGLPSDIYQIAPVWPEDYNPDQQESWRRAARAVLSQEAV
jgi:hypothetical protein